MRALLSAQPGNQAAQQLAAQLAMGLGGVSRAAAEELDTAQLSGSLQHDALGSAGTS